MKKLPRRVRRVKKAVAIARKSMLVAAGVGVGIGAAAYAARQRRKLNLLGRVVVITGGSRGLGLAMAEECARQGAVVAICARDGTELERARHEIESRHHVEVFARVCDVANNDEVREFINGVLSRFGQIDVLINNAGVISVGPVEAQNLTDYQESMDVMFWGVVYPTLAVLPDMKNRHSGRIANIASIGGKVAIPHLVPYCAAKFAAVGFSEGLRAELMKDGVRVTTVCPGLMRTGSHLNAYFKGKHRQEFTLFSFGATMPLVSIDARRAAGKIIEAVRAGDSELIITPQAKLLARFHGLFPGFTADILGMVNRLLPEANGNQRDRHLGKDSQTPITRSFLQRMGQNAAHELNQTEGRRASDKASA